MDEPLLPLPDALPQMKPWAELSPHIRRGLARLYRTTEAEAEATHEKQRALVEETRRVLAERSPQPAPTEETPEWP